MSRKASALLVYLAMHARPQPREVLAELLWEDRSQVQSMSNLRVVLSSLRKNLGDHLSISRTMVSANLQRDNIWLDAAHFSSQLQTSTNGEQADMAGLKNALALYQGDFLVGFNLHGCRDFEHWLLLEREQLWNSALKGFQRLVACYIRSNNFEAGLPYARQMVQLNPLFETGQRQLMRLLARCGQRNAALAQYETCRQLLQDELGVQPEEKTTRLYERIRSGQGRKPSVSQAASRGSSPTRPGGGAVSRNNLPPDLTRFIGRSRELDIILARLRDPYCRLLTLIGPGGIGKTRLATQAARVWLSSQAERVCYVPLEATLSQADLIQALAAELELQFYGNTSPRAQLLHYLETRNLLLVLDNYEQLLPETGLVLEILSTAPGIKLLVTSRHRLNLREEWLLDIEGLPFPDAEAQQAESFAAVQLFLQHARRIQSGFEKDIEPPKMSCVAEICRLSQGSPLAIELAAAWVRAISCEEIVSRLSQNLELLRSPLANAPERHHSMRAVFESAWSLLGGTEQQALRRLSVTRGGFDRQAAQEIAGVSLYVLSRLVDKSLLRRSGSRYDMHELLRQFAAEKLAANSSEEREAFQSHSAYFTRYLRERETRLKGKQQTEARADISRNLENVHTAWDWAVTHKRADFLGQAMESLWRFYELRGLFAEGRDRFQDAVTALESISQDGEVKLVWGRLLSRLARFCQRLSAYGDLQELFALTSSVLKELEEQEELAFVNLLVASLPNEYRLDKRQQILEQSVKILSKASQSGSVENRWRYAEALRSWGGLASLSGSGGQARFHFQNSLQIFRDLGDSERIAMLLNNLATHTEDLDKRRALLEENLKINERIGHQWNIAWTKNHLGQLFLDAGEYDRAIQCLDESLKKHRQVSDHLGMGAALLRKGEAHRKLGNPGRARELLEESLAKFEQAQSPYGACWPRLKMGEVALDQGNYESAGRHFQTTLGAAHQVGLAPVKAYAVIGWAVVHGKSGQQADMEQATAWLVMARRHSSVPSEAAKLAARELSALRSMLPAEAYQQAQIYGETAAFEQVVEMILAGDCS